MLPMNSNKIPTEPQQLQQELSQEDSQKDSGQRQEQSLPALSLPPPIPISGRSSGPFYQFSTPQLPPPHLPRPIPHSLLRTGVSGTVPTSFTSSTPLVSMPSPQYQPTIPSSSPIPPPPPPYSHRPRSQSNTPTALTGPSPTSISVDTPNSSGTFSNNDDSEKNNMTSPDDINSSSRFRKACLECRQQKLKCDAYEKAPDACSHCLRRHTKCAIDSNFSDDLGGSSGDHERNNTTSPDDLVISSRLRKIACVECRQQKVKCDAHERAPGACTRCMKRHLQCSIETNFKRTYKRARLAEVEKEVEELRRSLEVQHSQTSDQDMVSRTLLDLASGKSTRPSLSRSSSAEANAIVGNVSSIATAQDQTEVASLGILGQVLGTGLISSPRPSKSESFLITPRTLNGFTATKEQIEGLFTEYRTHYHPYLPVVDLSHGPDHIYSRSELLFWIILETASRIYSDVALFPILSTTVKELVSRQLNQPLRTAYDIQAILIFTLWPPPAGSLNSDPCWNSCGLAMFNAVKLGLHCTGRTQDFGRVKISSTSSETQEQVKTWVTCNIVSQLLSMALGYPTFSMYDWTINNAVQNMSFASALPFELRIQVHLAKFSDRMVKLLNRDVRDVCGNVDSQTRKTVIRVLAQELDELENSLSAIAISNISKLLIMVTRTQLYAYAFLDDDVEKDVDTLIQAYQTSIRTITCAEQLDEPVYNGCSSARGSVSGVTGVSGANGSNGIATSANSSGTNLNSQFSANGKPDSSVSQLLYLPLYLEIDICLAAFIILNVHFSEIGESLDTTAGKRSFASAIAIMRKSSVKENDFCIRVSTIMFQLWKLRAKDRADAQREGKAPYVSSKLKLRSRMAQSILFDSIWVWRERYGTFPVQPASTRAAQQHPIAYLQQQAEQRQQQYFQQQRATNSQPQSKAPSPRLRARQMDEAPQLRNTRGVMALLDSTNSNHMPTFEQQHSTLPSSLTPSDEQLSSLSSHLPIDPSTDHSEPTIPGLPIIDELPGQQQLHQQQQQQSNMGTDELVNFLDNDAVAFDHLYLDWQEMGVLWDDISSMFVSNAQNVDMLVGSHDGMSS
ncbi:uncharacterized protein V1516DRAFT_420438 [Lipomyces oligophaga]|uniref:uncharacterized protein n=1 Tax=Lipomyces oligophaga TaxID=45792 RepID=UPI0034CEE48F